MTTYRNIHGRSIQALSTDPTESVAEGQIWYNTNSDTFKSIESSSAWASASPMINAKAYRFGGGTQTAAFAAAGAPPFTATEEYNGSGWSIGGAIGTARYEGGSAGSQTAGLIFGGYAGTAPGSTATEEYDGSSWTAGGALNQTGYGAGGLGTQTAGLYASRFSGPSAAASNVTEEYNGTSWTAVSPGTQNTLVLDVGTAGTQTAGLQFGGQPPPGTTVVGNTESYDGSTWTAVNAMNNARSQLGGSGIQTAAIAFGGRFTPPGSVLRAFTEQYDGTSWSETADLGTARRQLSSTRVETGNTQALAFGGKPSPSVTDATEEFNQSANVITAAAWSSSTAINTARNSFGGFGLQTANIIAGGYGSPNVKNETEEWDGTSWSEKNNLNTARSHYGGSQASPYTAAVIFKGNTSASDTSTNATEEWDGTNWTTVTANPTTGQRNMGAGTQTAALSFGGLVNPAPPAPRTAATQEYDGTNWTSGGTMNTARNDGGGTGTQTAGLGYGGDVPGASAATEEYNGTAWTSVNNMAIASGYYGQCGQSQTDAMAVGNLYASPDNGCQHYDGTTWATRPLLGTARFDSAGSGTGTAAMVAGGAEPANTTAVEEFTGETTALNVKTLTQS